MTKKQEREAEEEEKPKRIIREIKEERFREVKKESEESLEDEVDESELESKFSDFSKFISKERVAPVLESTRESAGIELEETAASVLTPGAEEVKRDEAVTYIPRYDEKLYSRNYDIERVAPVLHELERTGRFVRPDEIGRIKPREEIRAMPGIASEEMSERVVETEALRREAELPFEERRRYRGKRL